MSSDSIKEISYLLTLISLQQSEIRNPYMFPVTLSLSASNKCHDMLWFMHTGRRSRSASLLPVPQLHDPKSEILLVSPSPCPLVSFFGIRNPQPNVVSSPKVIQNQFFQRTCRLYGLLRVRLTIFNTPPIADNQCPEYFCRKNLTL